MDTTIADLSPLELETLISNVIDQRMQVWLTQFLDAVGERQEEDDAEMQPEFEGGLRQALEQAHQGEFVSLKDLREQLTHE